MIMRQAPSPLLLDSIVGGDRHLVEGFDSILYNGEATPCFVFQGVQGILEPKREDNAFANMLWLQALVRKHGFSHAHTPSSITGPVAILFGDPEFMKDLAI